MANELLVGVKIGAVLSGTFQAAFEPLGIDLIGLNCATGPAEMSEHLRHLSCGILHIEVCSKDFIQQLLLRVILNHLHHLTKHPFLPPKGQPLRSTPCRCRQCCGFLHSKPFLLRSSQGCTPSSFG